MIEVIPNETPKKPNVTPELFDSCLVTIKDFCCVNCGGCERNGTCSAIFKIRPKDWVVIIPQTKGGPGTA